MTRKSTTKGQSVVERLLEQQKQYQDWIAKLDEEAAHAAPSHVAKRVRADYSARLDEVTQELKDHEDGVRQALAEAEARSEGLTRQHAERTDELAEARLRRQVGEFDEDQFEEVASRCKAALAELAKELAIVERDIDRYEEILTLIQPPPSPEPEPVIEVIAEAPPEPAPVPETRSRPSQPQMGLDEMEFLRSLTGQGGAPKPEAKSEPAPRPEPPRAEPVREPPRAEPPRVEAPPPPPPPRSEPPRAPEPRRAPPPPPAAVVEDQKERRHPDTRESEGGTKTLVCTECGTKNLPSEWYCEKCGAELAPY